MARFAISVTMDLEWRGSREKFANIYHYDAGAAVDWSDSELIDQLVANMRPVYSTAINFQEARSWGPVGAGPATNVTRLIKQLSGTGSALADDFMYREAAFLVQWPAGKSSVTGRPVFLRKWLHSCSQLGGSGAGGANGSAPIAANARATLQTYANAVRYLEDPNSLTHELCSPTGRKTTGQGVPYDYLEHHQFMSK